MQNVYSLRFCQTSCSINVPTYQSLSWDEYNCYGYSESVEGVDPTLPLDIQVVYFTQQLHFVIGKDISIPFKKRCSLDEA